MLKTFTTAEFTCHAKEVEANKKELSIGGYCWELSRFPNAENPYREYSFRVFIIINLTRGTVEPQ